MTRAEFLKMMGAGAAVLALDAVPGASLIQSANAQTTPLKKNQERLAFGKKVGSCSAARFWRCFR